MAQEGHGVPLGTVRSGLAWGTQILLVSGPVIHSPSHLKGTVSKHKALGTYNPEVIMVLVVFLAFPRRSCIPRQKVGLA